MKRIFLVMLMLFVCATMSAQATDRTIHEALALIQDKYISDMTREQLVERSLSALLKDLDPYSKYLNAEEWAASEAQFAAQFGGVGVQFVTDKETQLPRVRYLMIGSAAAGAGIVRGDFIAAVDGRNVKGMELRDVIPFIIGTPGSTVELTILRANTPSPITVKVQRKIIKTPSVRGVGHGQYLLDARRGIGYIRISRLAEDTVPETEKALVELRACGMRALILDLRDSAGGLMMSAVHVADLFLDSGRILRTVSRDEASVYDAKPGGILDVPMVVLINSGTASSSEFLAAALQDNHRATFLGQRTFGKARIQRKFALGDGRGGIILTTGTFERPSGKIVDRHDATDADQAGVAPDEELVVEGNEYETWVADAFQRDSPAILDASDPPPPPDRMLDRAVAMLVERTLQN